MKHLYRFPAPRPARSVRWLASALAAVIGLLGAAGSVTGHGPDPLVGGARWTQDQTLTFKWRRTRRVRELRAGGSAR